MDTVTNRGAFSTMIELKPAIKRIIDKLESQGLVWFCVCDPRRAKLYARYIPTEKIQIIND